MFRATLYILVFLLSVALLATIRSRRVRQSILLIGSYGVYLSWGGWFVAVLFFSTLLNFLVGNLLRRKPTRFVLTIGILLNLALLGSFKYLPEAAINFPFSSLQRFAHLALPLGISFWTFQAMSYLFDLYRGEELDPSFLEFALYMTFFPVAISGPICRLPDMLPQFRSEKLSSWDDIGLGFRRIASGILMMQLAKLLGQGILSGDGIDRGFDQSRNGPVPMSGAWRSATGYSFSSTSPVTRILPLGRQKRWALFCRRTLPVRFTPRRHPSFGRAGTCRCRSGFAIIFFSARGNAARDVVAKSCAGAFHDCLWIVAQGDHPVLVVGLLSRSSSRFASSNPAGGAETLTGILRLVFWIAALMARLRCP